MENSSYLFNEVVSVTSSGCKLQGLFISEPSSPDQCKIVLQFLGLDCLESSACSIFSHFSLNLLCKLTLKDQSIPGYLVNSIVPT